MLRISDVSYRYKTRKIPTLKHLSLHVTEGEMLLLAGCSGCGKSTLIKAVSGLLNTAGAGTQSPAETLWQAKEMVFSSRFLFV